MEVCFEKRIKRNGKQQTEKKKRKRDSHAEQYRPSDRDCSLWKMATQGDEDPSA